jgi:hypothetical protein
VPTATTLLDVQVRAGFEGFYKAGGWLPVTALARNEGPPLNGRLELVADPSANGSGNYSTAAVLPTHSSKRLTLVAPAPSAEHNRVINLTAGGRALVTQTVPVSALSPQDYLYGVISPNITALDVLRGVRQFDGAVSVAHLSLDDIPTSGPALNDVDALVLDDTATSMLSAAQRATLLGWVSSGGQLVLGGGVGAANTLGGLAEFAPVSLTGTTVVDIGAALSPWTHSPTSDNAPIALARPINGGVVRLQIGATPLVVDRPFGEGWVTFLAMSAATPSLHGAPGGASAWQQILTGSRHGLDGMSADPLGGGVGPSTAVYALPQATLPSGALLGWLIFGYILIIGPGNYLLMRRLDRREYLWLTIPMISLVFAGGAYFLARHLKGSEVIVNTVTIARHSAAAAALSTTSVNAAVGNFSPGRTSYDITIGNGLGIAPLDAIYTPSEHSNLAVVNEGATTLVQNIQVDKWSMQAFAVHGTGGESSPRPLVDTSLSLEGSVISGWVRNNGSALLQDVTLEVGNDSSPMMDLSPGEQHDVRLVLTGSVAPAASGGPGRPPRALNSGTFGDADTRQALLTGVLSSGIQAPGGYPQPGGLVGGPQILAFSSTAPFPVDVRGRQIQQHNTTLHLQPVAVGLPASGYTLPYGLAQRELLQNSGMTTQVSGPWLSLGTTTGFQFRLPSNSLGKNWSALHVRLSLMRFGRAAPTGQASTMSFALYNWKAAAWDPQPGFTQGISTVQQAGRYVDPRGLVRLRITGSNGQDQAQTLDIALDGPPQ